MAQPPNNLTSSAARQLQSSGRVRFLVTAGPTHEPLDRVRFIGNRSSGRMGIALAQAGLRRGWDTTLLLGPVGTRPATQALRLRAFQTCSDLQSLLADEAPRADVLVMAAAVADFRPKPHPAITGGKFRRTSDGMTLELEPTPDLLAGVAASRREGQFLVGFALEPRAEMLAWGREKLVRKGVDLVVANPLETMDSEGIEGVVLGPGGFEARPPGQGAIAKAEFAAWLLDVVERRREPGGAPL